MDTAGSTLYLPQDDDGIIQNNFIAGPAFHPFLLWLLKVPYFLLQSLLTYMEYTVHGESVLVVHRDCDLIEHVLL